MAKSTSTPAKKSAKPAAAPAAKKGNGKSNGKKPAAAKKAPAAKPADHGANVAASWNDPKVRAARIERTAVRVAGTEYTSVPMAFIALKLPMGQMVRFRKMLKAEGKATFESGDKKHNFVALAAA